MTEYMSKKEELNSKIKNEEIHFVYRRKIEEICRRLRESRKARFRLFLILLFLIFLNRLRIHLEFFWMNYAQMLNPLRTFEEDHKELGMWSPSCDQDFAPRPGGIEYCDGYTREEWDILKIKHGLWKSKKDELSRAWKADPLRVTFPARYQDYDTRPTMPQLMVEMREPYWRADAFAAIKLIAPPEVHDFLDYAYAVEPHELRRCYAETTDGIISNIRSAALRWEARKRKEAEELKREFQSDMEMSRPI